MKSQNAIISIFVAIFIAFVFRYTVASPYKIPTGSMIPTLKIGDFIFVSKMSYALKLPFTNINLIEYKKPKAGDVIVFIYPENPALDYIKRVVAVAGDEIELRDSVLYINGKSYEKSKISVPPELSEGGKYYYKETISETTHVGMEFTENEPMPSDNFGPYVIPPEHVFAMGDNRDNSQDSRFWGPLPIKNIRGKAMFIWLSLNSNEPLFEMSTPALLNTFLPQSLRSDTLTIPSLRIERFGMNIH